VSSADRKHGSPIRKITVGQRDGCFEVKILVSKAASRGELQYLLATGEWFHNGPYLKGVGEWRHLAELLYGAMSKLEMAEECVQRAIAPLGYSGLDYDNASCTKEFLANVEEWLSGGPDGTYGQAAEHTKNVFRSGVREALRGRYSMARRLVKRAMRMKWTWPDEEKRGMSASVDELRKAARRRANK
jgi:hypothetical protein